MRENSLRQQARESRTRHRKEQLYTVHERESRHTRLCLERDVNREQHRHSNKSYGTMGGQRSQTGALQRAVDPAMNPTVELHRTKEEAIEEFV